VSTESVLVSIEMRFVTTEQPGPLADRLREAMTMIVGRQALEDFRVRSMPLAPKKRPGGDRGHPSPA